MLNYIKSRSEFDNQLIQPSLIKSSAGEKSGMQATQIYLTGNKHVKARTEKYPLHSIHCVML